jgi:hypothetical protein
MEFLKKVITSVSSSSGIAADFPYQLDENISDMVEDIRPPWVWTVHKGHHVLFYQPPMTAKA